MDYEVDVAIIGAGTAGLSALAEVRKVTDNYLLINGGELGTTCARVGCMPSKVLIQTANDYFRRLELPGRGIHGEDKLQIESREVLNHLRKLRDGFVQGVVEHLVEPSRDKLMLGYAEFVEPTVLQVGSDKVHAGAVIIATGTRPLILDQWKGLEENIWTYENVFEQSELPDRIGIVGLGAIGVELGQALSRMGIKVTGFDVLGKIGGLKNSEVSEKALDAFGREFSIHLGSQVDLEKEGSRIRMVAGDADVTVEKVLVSIGGIPNVDSLHLDRLGLTLDGKGIPPFDPESMQIGDLPVFIAGDVNGFRPVLHEASFEGKVAGYNAVHKPVTRFIRQPAMTIGFCEPNICSIGADWDEIADANPAVGKALFKGGRSRIMGREQGMIALYGDPENGQILGAELVGPRGEHLAHLLALSIAQGQTVFDLLELPFYHPTIEETLEGALKDLAKKVRGDKPAMWGFRVK